MPGKWDKYKGLLPNVEKPKDLLPGGLLTDKDIDALNNIAVELDESMSAGIFVYAPATVSDTIDRYARIRNLKSLLALAEKLCNKSLQSLNIDLLNKIEEWGMSSISNEQYTCSSESGIFPSVENKEELAKFLKDSNMDELRTVPSSTLAALARTHLAEGLGPIPGVKAFFGEKVQVRKKP